MPQHVTRWMTVPLVLASLIVSSCVEKKEDDKDKAEEGSTQEEGQVILQPSSGTNPGGGGVGEPEGDGSGSDDGTGTEEGTGSVQGNDSVEGTDDFYSVGGTLDYYYGNLVLQLNGADDLTIEASGQFTFATALKAGTAYEVSILSQPSGANCVLLNEAGTVAAGDVTDIFISCSYDWSLTCDTGLTLDSTDAADAAKTLDACMGVAGAAWELPDGSVMATAPVTDVTALGSFHLGHGLLTAFGVNVQPRRGERMLALSSGTARQPVDAGYAAPAPAGTAKGYQHALPGVAGFPSKGDNASCDLPSSDAFDGIAFHMTLTVPDGVTGFTVDYKYTTTDYPTYVCSQYIDQAAILVTASGVTDQNIMLTNGNAAVNANINPMDVCMGCIFGSGEILGTGYDSYGATSWRQAIMSGLTAGDSVSVRFMIWDTFDGTLDSTMLMDNFQWITN